MPQSLNEIIVDEINVHAVNLERLKAGQVSKVGKMLKTLEKDLVQEIAAYAPTDVSAMSYKQKRLEALLQQTRATIATHYKKISNEHKDALKRVAKIEGDYSQDLINKPVGVQIASVALSPEQLTAIAGDAVVNGTIQSEWWKRQAEATRQRFADSMRQGMLRGETLDELVRRVRGTKAKGYTDGIMNLSKKQAETLVRTSVQTVANAARIESYKNNADVIKAVQQISTLDGRTSQICIARSGKVWSLPDFKPIGHSIRWAGGPGGNLHWNCRSTVAPVTKSWEELGADGIQTGGKPAQDVDAYFKKRLKERLGDKISDAQLDDMVRNTQASMDGYVPESMDYESWLKTKPEAFQKKILGDPKYKLWKSGKITFSDLIDESNRPLSIDELEKLIADRNKPKPEPKPKKPKKPKHKPLPDNPEDYVDYFIKEGDKVIRELEKMDALTVESLPEHKRFNFKKIIELDNVSVNDFDKWSYLSSSEQHALNDYVKRLQSRINEQLKVQRGAGEIPITISDKYSVGQEKAHKLTREAADKLPKSWIKAANDYGEFHAFETSETRQWALTNYWNTSTFTHTIPRKIGEFEMTFHPKEGIILVGDPDTTLHELCHRLQNVLPDLDDAFNRVHRKRTAGESLIKLNDLHPGGSYKDDEVCRKDKYKRAYFGKEYDGYPRPAMEMITMSMEYLLSEDWRMLRDFLVHDPELFKFTLGALFRYDPLI